MTDSATKDDLLGAEDTVKAVGLSGMFFASKPQVNLVTHFVFIAFLLFFTEWNNICAVE